MKNNKTFILALIPTLVIGACSHTSLVEQPTVTLVAASQPTVTTTSPIQFTQSDAVQKLLVTDIETLWSQGFDHYQEGLLLQVSQIISQLAKKGNLTDKDLEKLTFYLRVYASFGPDKDWPEQTASVLNNALFHLQEMPGFYQLTPTTVRLHENYVVALYRLYFIEALQLPSADHVKPLTKLIDLYANADLTLAGDDFNKEAQYALWEILRASAILPYEATRKNKAQHLAVYGNNSALPQALLAFMGSENAKINGDDWPRKHAAWALAQYYNVYNKQYSKAYYEKTEAEQKQLDNEEIMLPEQQKMTDLDNMLWQALSNSLAKTEDTQEQLKVLFSIPYVVTTFRGKSECEESSLKGRCISPTVEEATPIKHICSDSLFIRTQKMTDEQLDNACRQLISQEAVFHEKLATKHEPVANDFNDKLRVVVFNNAAEYNKYGQLTFDIGTNNGGMYIEGTTQDPENLATFYSYEHFWVRPKFQVWNLHHEYVHYLDGRFIKYDTFNHFPSHLVWWSEGLAEYISKGDNNPKAFKLVHETNTKDWLTLQQVFDTNYRDSNKQVYKWGYLAVRFMYEQHRAEYRQLAHFLKTDFFDGYKKLLDESGEKYQAEFNTWLTKHNENFTDVDVAKNPHQPRQFYRYTYKDYLQPANLTETPRHRHWQYWHANALKAKTL
ncbi:MAG: collagenase [Colwellia sp.]|nr:collagenase [Colwellia sp.]